MPSNDVDALTAALREKLEAKEALNLRARQRILENFTVPHLGDLTEQALIARRAAFEGTACGRR